MNNDGLEMYEDLAYYTKEEYIEWLIDKVSFDGSVTLLEYSELFMVLLDTTFTWIHDDRNELSHDENRAGDGHEMRRIFCETHDYTKDYFESALKVTTGCSMLEMLVALACRMDDEVMYDNAYGDRSYQWFYDMLHSMGLLKYFNGNVKNRVTEIKGIIKKFNTRAYRPSGKGGLFWVNASKRAVSEYFSWIPDFELDMTDIEIWQQMGIWTQLLEAKVIENPYEIEHFTE